MRIQPDFSGASVVFLGSFNPRIFRPEWFAAKGIIGEQEAASATIKVIHPALASFALDWASLDVGQDRFNIVTEVSPLIRLRDLVVKTFKECLPETPIFQVGLNRSIHFDAGSAEIREKIGLRLAPREPWGEWGKRIAGTSEDPKRHGGVLTLTMTQRDRGDEYTGAINTRIEPSVRLPTTGIFMEVNDHYDLGEPDKIFGSEKAVKVVESQWDVSMDRSETIFDQIMALKEQLQ